MTVASYALWIASCFGPLGTMTHMSKLGLVVLVLGILGCGGSSSPESPRDRLVGEWLFTDGTHSGSIGATFNDDGTYVAWATRGATGSSMERGIYDATDNTFTNSPTEWTCRGSYPAYTETYSFSGLSPVVVDVTGVTTLLPDNAPGPTAALPVGCFDKNGNFTPSPLAPVTN
jgi:hypothetical protein